MGTGKICIGIFCACTIALFGFMSYLMRDINPPPIKSEDDISDKEDVKDNKELKFENVIFDDVPKVEVLQYGLEKFDNEHLEYSTHIPGPQNTGTAIYDNLWKFTARKVVPPLWPMPTAIMGRKRKLPDRANITHDEYNTTETWANDSLYNQTDTKNFTEILGTNYTSIIVPVKRSVRDFKKIGSYEIPPPIVLNILDESKQLKIEIKLGPSETRQNRYRKNRNSLKNKAKFSMSLQSQNRDELIMNDLAKNTIMRIMPNDSVIVDEYDYDANVSEENNIKKGLTGINKEINGTRNIYLKISVDQNTTAHNITDYENIVVNKTENKVSNVSHLQNITVNNITDYEIILFNETRNMDSNIFHVQNTTTRDYEKILVTKIKPNRNKTTKIPIYKDIFTLKVLFDDKTKSIHSDAQDEEDHHSHNISNHLKVENNKSEVLRTENYTYTIITYATTTTFDFNNYSTINTEKSIKKNKNSVMQIISTESYTSIIDTESTFPIIKSTQNEATIDNIMNSTAYELTNSDDKTGLDKNFYSQ